MLVGKKTDMLIVEPSSTSMGIHHTQHVPKLVYVSTGYEKKKVSCFRNPCSKVQEGSFD